MSRAETEAWENLVKVLEEVLPINEQQAEDLACAIDSLINAKIMNHEDRNKHEVSEYY